MKIYADTSDIESITELNEDQFIAGFTTNPTLMRKASVRDYESFARQVLEITDKPVSFEVIADDFNEMERQARKIASWGNNVYVKIPITNTKGELSHALIERLLAKGVKVNVTAITRETQVGTIPISKTPMIVSVFAGRIADTGVDPVPIIEEIRDMCLRPVEILWASAREIFNVKQAEAAGCDIITLSPDLIKKLDLYGKDLREYSLETVQQFYDDAKAAGYRL